MLMGATWLMKKYVERMSEVLLDVDGERVLNCDLLGEVLINL